MEAQADARGVIDVFRRKTLRFRDTNSLARRESDTLKGKPFMFG